MHPDSIVMASFPLSGNTLLRAFMEKITGIVTGSEADITLGLIQALMDEGLEGEGLVDDHVWVVKSHHPERTGIV